MSSLAELLEAAASAARLWEKKTKDEPIQIWEWEHCPDEFKGLIDDWDDIDYVAYVPQAIYDRTGGWIPFLDIGGFAPCCVKEFPAPGGILFVGYHA